MNPDLLTMKELDALTQLTAVDLDSLITRFSRLTNALDRAMWASDDTAFRSQIRNQRTRVQALLDVAQAWRDVSEVV